MAFAVSVSCLSDIDDTAETRSVRSMIATDSLMLADDGLDYKIRAGGRSIYRVLMQPLGRSAAAS